MLSRSPHEHMPSKIKKQHFYHLTPLYEQLYWLVQRLIPDLRHLSPATSLILDNEWKLLATIDSQERYTSLLTFSISFAPKALPDLTMKIRVYHDAKVAEAVEYQGQGALLPDYVYPNPAGFHPDEKRQTNLLLKEWLVHFDHLGIELDYQTITA